MISINTRNIIVVTSMIVALQLLLNHHYSSSDNIYLRTRINSQNDIIQKYVADNLYRKYLIAIQDINSIDRIEPKINKNSQQKLIRLRKKRNGFSHYIDGRNTDGCDKFRRMILYQRLINMPDDVKQLFELDFLDSSNFISQVLPFIQTDAVCANQNIVNQIDEWWKDTILLV
ncbi:MAG: hypothetical protein Gaeavirus2_8 [Gaeavirus sp.]|uniref:Uncharacterized protein n=1 Tax=Gaeavirus sp. TaxID=2487767 RepID=A0A3G4ZYC8_9VIRU|nr:MAG: hypothetical protein Gaeavirus2_8 [Gaeavirus sp.]